MPVAGAATGWMRSLDRCPARRLAQASIGAARPRRLTLDLSSAVWLGFADRCSFADNFLEKGHHRGDGGLPFVFAK